MFDIGVVGPKESVTRIMNETAAYESEFQFHRFEYDSVNEVYNILSQNDKQIDYWLFSGHIPYSVARKTSITKRKIDCIYYTVNDINDLILQYIFDYEKIPSTVSLDMLEHQETLKFISNVFTYKKDLQRFTKLYTEDTKPEELAEYHLALWKENKIDFVITSFPSVEQILKKYSVPCYWMGPTKMNIFHSLELVEERIKTNYYKNTQTTAVSFKIMNFESLRIVKLASYSLEHLLLDLKKIVLQCCEKLEGFLVEHTLGQYTIFTTRGIAERKIHEIYLTKEKLFYETNLPVLIGIGHADTTYKAEQFSTKAVNHLNERNQDHFLVMDEDGVITQGTLDKQISYSVKTPDEKLVKKLEGAAVSAKVYYRIEAVIHENRWKEFTSKDLSLALHMSERNAQRIISELTKVNLVELVGEEQRNSRGRTSKVYKLVGQ